MTDGTPDPGSTAGAGSEQSDGKHGRGKIIESFAPTGGRVLGIIVLVIAFAALVDIVIEWRSLDGLTAAAIIIGLGTLVWMSMVRPGIALYDNALVMRNFVRDVQIPWHLVSDAEVRPILTVTADGKPYRSVAIAATGADRRAMWKARAGTQGLSGVDLHTGTPSGPAPAGSESPVRPALHAASRVRTVAEKNAERSKPLTGVERFWAWPEIIVVGVAALVAVITSILPR